MEQTAIKYTTVFLCKTILDLPKLVWESAIWQPCSRHSTQKCVFLLTRVQADPAAHFLPPTRRRLQTHERWLIHFALRQGDQIFAAWTFSFFGQFLENYRSSPKYEGQLFFHVKNCAQIWTKKAVRTFWAIF
jgi:hypothetical protein